MVQELRYVSIFDRMIPFTIFTRSATNVSSGNIGSAIVDINGDAYFYFHRNVPLFLDVDIWETIKGKTDLIPNQPIKQKIKKLKFPTKIRQISIGSGHIGILDEYGQLYMLGRNNKGQLGLGDKSDRPRPTLVENLKQIKYVSCGMFFTVVITDKDDVYTFGSNIQGQLGINSDQQNQLIPKLIEKYNDDI